MVVRGMDTAVVNTAVQPPSAPEKVPAKQPTSKGEKKVEKVTAVAVQQEQTTPPPPSKDRNKKRRNELATLQQMSEYSPLVLHVLHEDYCNVYVLVSVSARQQQWVCRTTSKWSGFLYSTLLGGPQ
jgi:hypothetical protein